MECIGGTRTTVRTVARIAALAAAGVALVGGVAAAAGLGASAPGPPLSPPDGRPDPAALLVALPDRIGASNRAW
jgi:hypothetical protein